MFKDFIKLFIFVNILFLPLAFFDLRNSVESLYRNQKIETYNLVQESQNRIIEYFNESDLVGACTQLKAEQKSHVINLYYLETKEGTCHFPKTLITTPVIPMNSAIVREFEFHQSQIAMTGYQSSSNKLIIGRFISPKKSLNDYLFNYSIIFNAAMSEFFRSFLITLIIIFTLMVIFSQQIKKIFKRDKNSWWIKTFITIFNRFQLGELNLVKKLTEVLNNENIKLITYSEFIENSLEQSLLKEIKENQLTLPLTFEGTVARVDINGFSTVVAENSDKISFMLTDAMEQIGCELIKRYSGLFEKTVGDEIIVLFRGKNSRLFAIAFIRDLMREFSKLEFKIQNSNQFFLMKGTLSTSPINFRKRRSGYGFDGFALTLTARLLSVINRKDTNIVSVLSSDLQYIQSLIGKTSTEEKFIFKNMSADLGVFFDEFKSIQDYTTEELLNVLTYFRSDKDICEIMNLLLNDISFDLKKNILIHLKSFSTNSISELVKLQWLQTIQSISENLKSENASWILANLISLGNNLIPKTDWSSNISQQLILFLNESFDSRVMSAVIETLTYKDLNFLNNHFENNQSNFEKSNRIQGDMLIADCLTSISEQNLQKILNMLNSTNEIRANTGIYVSAVVLISCLKKNRALLNTFKEYHQIVNYLETIKSTDQLTERLKLFVDTAIQDVRS